MKKSAGVCQPLAQREEVSGRERSAPVDEGLGAGEGQGCLSSSRGTHGGLSGRKGASRMTGA